MILVKSYLDSIVELRIMFDSVKLLIDDLSLKTQFFLFHPFLDCINYSTKSSRSFYYSKYIYFILLPFSSFTGLSPFHCIVIDFQPRFTPTLFHVIFFFLPINHACKIILILLTYFLFILFSNFQGIIILVTLIPV